MNKWAIGVGALVLVVAAFWAVTKGTKPASEIEFRYATVAKGELTRSTSSTGVLVPLTKVDVKSKAGGKVVKLLVEEGTPVKLGQTIALIDPEDTMAAYQQAEADVTSARSKVNQAKTNVTIEVQNAINRVRDAEISLQLAKVRLDRTRQSSQAQPRLSNADLKSAEANLVAAQEALRTLEQIQVPQTRRDAQGQYDLAKADLDAAQSEMTRQQNLLNLGYVSQSSVEKQRTALAAATATFRLAEQRQKTIDSEIDSDLRTSKARLRQAEQSLEQAKANQNKVPITAKDLEEAKQNVLAAQVALKEAQTARMNVQLKQSDVSVASASAVRSGVAMRNAKVQLESTTVVAPRDGIVTLKYLEEGTIIPPGTSTFSQGTSLVQIADTTTMFVECSVDEADISNIRLEQPVRVIVEAYPGQTFPGVVRKIFPAAETANALTTVKVRVQVVGPPTMDSQSPAPKTGQKAGAKADVLRPGMNATCEFLQFSKKDVMIVPQQAINRENGKVTVRVKTSDDKKPEVREVKVGQAGNDGIEVLEGLKEGDQVVIAEIDLRAMRDRQTKMDQAQQGGGFGSSNRGGPSQSRASTGGGSSSSGSRPGGK